MPVLLEFIILFIRVLSLAESEPTNVSFVLRALVRFFFQEMDPKLKRGIPVELWLSAQNLPQMDLLSKSDPFVVVSMRGQDGVYKVRAF